MTHPQRIELLSPARNANCGIDAINCGADAVYIGASHFSARAEAANQLDDIARLTDYAHQFGAKVYVALNTILYDNELARARQLALDLSSIGVDALITQDMALLRMDLPLPLHASTQTDNRTPEKVRFLADAGFRRVILARELSVNDICSIHKACPEIELEAFVHGSLCVSYSGRCYASQYCFGRSANRGECAQFCRLAFDLEDSDGRVVLADKHLLSMKDMNRSSHLAEMLQAGIRSFKIEGRLKDASYVKNITAYYRRKLDDIINAHPKYVRSSFGIAHNSFDPQPQKSFNRGFTEYFLHGRNENVASIHTPKSIGEPVGKVKEIIGRSIRVAGTAAFHNGDGLCYFDRQGKLHGFRVNRADNNLLFLTDPQPELSLRTPLFRNHDAAFEQQLARSTQPRTLAADIVFDENATGFRLTVSDECGRLAQTCIDIARTEARSPQCSRIAAEISKLGGTGLEARSVRLELSNEWFIPASRLSAMRREAVGMLLASPIPSEPAAEILPNKPHRGTPSIVNWTANVANAEARRFYESCGAKVTDMAFELSPRPDTPLMICRHCIRYTLGYCSRYGGKKLPEPLRHLFLRMHDGRRFRLEFNCTACEMSVYACE